MRCASFSRSVSFLFLVVTRSLGTVKTTPEFTGVSLVVNATGNYPRNENETITKDNLTPRKKKLC